MSPHDTNQALRRQIALKHFMNHLKSLLGIELSPVSYREKLVSMAGGLVAILFLTLVTERMLHLSGATAVRKRSRSSIGSSAPWLAGAGFFMMSDFTEKMSSCLRRTL